MSAARRSVFDLPKAHLYLHLALSARMETIAEFADGYGVDLSDVWTFSNLSEFRVKGEVMLDLVRRPSSARRPPFFRGTAYAPQSARSEISASAFVQRAKLRRARPLLYEQDQISDVGDAVLDGHFGQAAPSPPLVRVCGKR